jgi:hypothetical protein
MMEPPTEAALGSKMSTVAAGLFGLAAHQTLIDTALAGQKLVLSIQHTATLRFTSGSRTIAPPVDWNDG